jgi:hypothetical protein
MRPYRFLTVLLALVTIVGLPGSGWAQAGAGRADKRPTPDETAVHDYVLSMDNVTRYAEAMKKIQAGGPPPAASAEMQKIQAANVYSVEKADMMAKSPQVAAAFKALGITPRDFVLLPLTVQLAGTIASAGDNPKMKAAFSYITAAQIQFVKDHKADLEKAGLM